MNINLIDKVIHGQPMSNAKVNSLATKATSIRTMAEEQLGSCQELLNTTMAQQMHSEKEKRMIQASKIKSICMYIG